MTQTVTVAGVGDLQFPDGMSQSDMAAAIQKNYPQIHGAAQPEPSALDMLKRAGKDWVRRSMLGVKGINDSVVRTALFPSDAVTNAANKLTGDHAGTPLGEQYQQWSDKETAPATTTNEQVAQGLGGLMGGLAVPLPGAGAGRQAGQLAESVAIARNAGYKVPPAVSNPTVLNRTIQGLLGNKETLAEASAHNSGQAVNNLASQFGLPAGTEVTHDVMESVRNNAGKAYDAVRGLGPQYGQLVDTIKGLRSDASKLYRQNSANYNATVEKNADAMWQKAQEADSVLAGALKQSGNDKLLADYLEARKTIAQTHDVDKAIVNSNATVKPQTFANAYAKEKPQSGAVYDLGRSAQAFGPAFNTVANGGSALTKVDNILAGSGAGLLAMHSQPEIAGATLAAALTRAMGRKALMSGPVQDWMLLSPEQKRAALAESLLRGNIAANGQE